MELIQDFHKAVNAKDLHRLDQLLANDCQFQDLIFYETFQGKQGVIRFISSLMDAMGPNIHMVIESVIEGDDLTACAIWHLGKFFECEAKEGNLFIRNITGVEELPLKPGDLVLKLLKSVSTLFDLYPVIAEGLLHGLKSQSTHEGIDMLLDILRKRHLSN
ncbi:hypothetical protein FNV43_RR10720 [Rhamnella rubrinervis]|uniref:SnoaL-like domain-containing protein n=1 Tax=Rhamnella rubrinervis TaxID=2594499 RepID=A0A8K0H4R2_9ROSA|nr:hypothetical protein FNV43_RR10720 [Rhamnella rubrinervis]